MLMLAGKRQRQRVVRARNVSVSVGSAALHEANLGVDGVRVLGPYLRLPPAN
jgi:hypothetical protein